jgi:isoamylase
MRVWPGRPYPLGATWDGRGVNFALFSENATRIELCLFDGPADRRGRRVDLTERTDHVFHAYLPGERPGRLYGYRAHGPYEPALGHRFNPNKLLFDPYAKAVGRGVTWDDALHGYTIGHADADLSFDERDSAPFAPLAAVVDPAFDWGNDRPPDRPWHETLVYELHVGGFTKKLPGVPESLRGTYAGVGTGAAIRHLMDLNVTAVELLPVHYHLDDRHLLERGLTNYWGYNTLGFFAPESTYATAPGRAAREFREMVKALHAAGIEVILDVVFNHTAEGNQLGPTLSFRGLDNASYYLLSPEDPRYTMDFTGCGNTPRLAHPRVLQLVADSLRYWVAEMHVDGFRFDLAAALAREALEADARAGFFRVVRQDPVLSRVKLIAEPWDVGPDGYMVGKFPPGWAEWNGDYRDVVRDYWAGNDVAAKRLADRLAGSPDHYERAGRRPQAGVNFVTAHDGFTLADLVSYNEKHNQANGEENRDGHSDNRSWNCGREGPTDDPGVNELRDRQRRNLLATLFLSQGVPMIVAGDELGHTQHGNNNAYCQDNDLTWLDWRLDGPRAAFLEFVKKLSGLWHGQPVLRRRAFFKDLPGRDAGEGTGDLSWFAPSGAELAGADWENPARALAVRLSGDRIAEPDERGDRVVGDTLLVTFNVAPEATEFVLPGAGARTAWELVLDTADPDRRPESFDGGGRYEATGRSVAVFRARPTE